MSIPLLGKSIRGGGGGLAPLNCPTISCKLNARFSGGDRVTEWMSACSVAKVVGRGVRDIHFRAVYTLRVFEECFGTIKMCFCLEKAFFWVGGGGGFLDGALTFLACR